MKNSLLAGTLATVLTASILVTPVAGAATLSPKDNVGWCSVDLTEGEAEWYQGYYAEWLYLSNLETEESYRQVIPDSAAFADEIIAMPGMKEKLWDDFTKESEYPRNFSQEMIDELDALWEEKGREKDPNGQFQYVIHSHFNTEFAYRDALRIKNGEPSLIRTDPTRTAVYETPASSDAHYGDDKSAEMKEKYAEQIAAFDKNFQVYTKMEIKAAKLCDSGQLGTVDYPSGPYTWSVIRDSPSSQLSDGAIAGIVIAVLAALAALAAAIAPTCRFSVIYWSHISPIERFSCGPSSSPASDPLRHLLPPGHGDLRRRQPPSPQVKHHVWRLHRLQKHPLRPRPRPLVLPRGSRQ